MFLFVFNAYLSNMQLIK